MQRNDTATYTGDDFDIPPGAPVRVLEVFGDSVQIAYTEFDGSLVTEVVDTKDLTPDESQPALENASE